MADYIPRNITHRLQEALAESPVTLLAGARRVGKTTLSKAVLGELSGTYRTFDDPVTLGLARQDPTGFVDGLTAHTTIDEIQLVPELFRAIKRAVDNDPDRRFLLTGSANVMILPRLSDSLAGRLDIVRLFPFSQGEITGHKEGFVDRVFSGGEITELKRLSRAEVLQSIALGGYPEAVRRGSAARGRWFENYIETVVSRDVRDIAAVDALVELPRLLGLLASRAGGLLNIADLARSLSLPQTTLRRYVALFETVFLTRRLPSWSSNVGQRLVKAAKIFFDDCGLLAHLLRFDPDDPKINTNPYLGPLLENFVVMEILKQVSWSKVPVDAFHFRTPKGGEIDLILEGPGRRLVALEVKATSTPSPRDFLAIRRFAERYADRFLFGAVLYMGHEVVPAQSNIFALPISTVWLPAD